MSTTNISNNPEADRDGVESSGVKGQASEAAGTAADEGKRVASVAKDEAKNVTAEAQNQLQGLLEQATTQVDEQSKEQKSRLVETVRAFGDDLNAMTSNHDGGGKAVQIVQQIADQARGLASHLDDREPRELLDDVRRYARQRPGTFLLGALAAGIVVGRLARSAKAGHDQNPTADVQRAVSGTTNAAPATARDEGGPTGNGHRVSGQSEDHAQTDLGSKSVEMSQAGIRSSSGGPA